MENQTANNPNEKNKNSKVLLYVIIGVLVALNAGLLYMWQKSGSEKQKISQQLTTASNENKELTASLDEAEFLLKKIREDSAILASKNVELDAELTQRKNELASTVAQLRSSKNASKGQIDNLNAQIAALNTKIAELEAQNKDLSDRNAQLDEERKQLQTENEEVKTTNTRITEENTKMKQRLLSESIKVEPMRKKLLSSKETETNRAKNVEAISTSFTISENPNTTPGEKIIYVKITGPGGVTLANGNEGGTTEFEKEETKYTYKISTTYDNASKSINNSIWRPSGELKPGNYTVELFCEGFKMGGAGFALK